MVVGIGAWCDEETSELSSSVDDGIEHNLGIRVHLAAANTLTRYHHPTSVSRRDNNGLSLSFTSIASHEKEYVTRFNTVYSHVPPDPAILPRQKMYVLIQKIKKDHSRFAQTTANPICSQGSRN